MADHLATSIDLLDRLIAFDTTSRLSNLELIADVQSYFDGLGIATRLTHNHSFLPSTFIFADQFTRALPQATIQTCRARHQRLTL